MPKPILTEPIARAAAADAGNHNMRRNGRSRWNEDDYEAAAAEYERLWPTPGHPAPGEPATTRE